MLHGSACCHMLYAIVSQCVCSYAMASNSTIKCEFECALMFSYQNNLGPHPLNEHFDLIFCRTRSSAVLSFSPISIYIHIICVPAKPTPFICVNFHNGQDSAFANQVLVVFFFLVFCTNFGAKRLGLKYALDACGINTISKLQLDEIKCKSIH